MTPNREPSPEPDKEETNNDKFNPTQLLLGCSQDFHRGKRGKSGLDNLSLSPVC